MSRTISMIYARTDKYGIGNKGDLPWGRQLPTDLRFFRAITTYHSGDVLVVGNNTFKTLPIHLFETRKLAVLTSNPEKGDDRGHPNVTFVSGVHRLLKDVFPTENLIVIGGGEIYKQFDGIADVIYETIVHGQNFDVDTDMCWAKVPRGAAWSLQDTHLINNCDKSNLDVIFNIWTSQESQGTLRFFDILKRPMEIAYYLEDDRFYTFCNYNHGKCIEEIVLMSGWLDKDFPNATIPTYEQSEIIRAHYLPLNYSKTKDEAEKEATKMFTDLNTDTWKEEGTTLAFLYNDFNTNARWGLYKACKAYKLPMKFIK